jgi:hypothetical protein
MMNEFEKQVDKKKRRDNNRLRKWWLYNGYKVWRVVLFWIWLPLLLIGYIDEKTYQAIKYNDDTTKKYLDKIMPYLVSHWHEEPNCFLVTSASDMGGVPFEAIMNLPGRYRKQERYFEKFYREARAYIVRTYEINGYEKFPIMSSADWYAAKAKFDWGSVPYYEESAKGVVFYK